MKTQRISQQRIEVVTPSPLARDMQDFLLDVQTANRAASTIRFYRVKLTPFVTYMREQGVTKAEGIEAAHVRAFLGHLSADHNAGGVHAYWRALRAFFRFLVREDVLERNPLVKIRPPQVDTEPLQPVNLEHLTAMLATCDRSDIGQRDKALLLALLDTGLRAGECVALNVGDVNLNTGAVLVRKSKNHKPRTVFLGRQARRAVSRYLRARGDVAPTEPLWLAYHKTGEVERLRYEGLREILRRRARAMGVPAPTLHSFRRGFALTMLRNGADIASLSRMMGHGSLGVLMQYLRQEADDLRQVHEQHSPVDRLRM